MAARDGDGWVDCQCGSKHWGRYGAAGLLLVNQRRILLQLRAPWVHNGDTWGIPGGARDSHESAIEAALRECREEVGLDHSKVEPRFSHIDDHGSWSYETIVAQFREVDARFVKNQETIDLSWVAIDEVASVNLHPSFARTWPEINARLRGVVDSIS